MTKIEWCDETWNPITGCTPVSEGCRNCYARRMATRLRGRFGYPDDDPFRPGTFHADELEKPLRWKKPRRIFVCSMGDMLHDAVSTGHIDAVLEVIGACPQHTFMVLTKRPENYENKVYGITEANPFRELGGGDYLPNLQVGVSVENQETADVRIPALLRINPVAVRFVSYEPALGPIQLWGKNIGGTRWIGGQRGCAGTHAHNHPHDDGTPGNRQHHHHDSLCGCGIDGVIAGGESGPGAHPAHPDWFRSVRGQCADARVPFFFKSWGDYAIDLTPDVPDKRQYHVPSGIGDGRGIIMRHVGKRAAGRLLDGREHNDLPGAKK